MVRALGGKVPVIGFVGAPFTMASYMIEGGSSRNFIRTKRMMYGDETLWRRLMGKIVDVLAPFAALQVAAGARAIQVFDSWVGALGPDDYVRFVAPYSRALIERIRSTGVPVIHFGTGASGFFRELHAAGGDVMGVDWRINIDQAWMDISYRSAIQGNLDPAVLFAPLPELKMRVHELLKRTGTRPGHIFNLGHGILPETPVDNVKAVVQMVREFRRSVRTRPMPSVAIVGGGISGLSAAYYLAKAGIASHPDRNAAAPGRRHPNRAHRRLRGRRRPGQLSLRQALGHGSDPRAGSRRRRHRLERSPAQDLHPQGTAAWSRCPMACRCWCPPRLLPMLRSPLLSWRTKVRMALEYFRRPRAAPDRDRSVAEFVADHYGQETVDYLAEPLLSGVYGGDPARAQRGERAAALCRAGSEVRQPDARRAGGAASGARARARRYSARCGAASDAWSKRFPARWRIILRSCTTPSKSWSARIRGFASASPGTGWTHSMSFWPAKRTGQRRSLARSMAGRRQCSVRLGTAHP